MEVALHILQFLVTILFMEKQGVGIILPDNIILLQVNALKLKFTEFYTLLNIIPIMFDPNMLFNLIYLAILTVASLLSLHYILSHILKLKIYAKLNRNQTFSIIIIIIISIFIITFIHIRSKTKKNTSENNLDSNNKSKQRETMILIPNYQKQVTNPIYNKLKTFNFTSDCGLAINNMIVNKLIKFNNYIYDADNPDFKITMTYSGSIDTCEMHPGLCIYHGGHVILKINGSIIDQIKNMKINKTSLKICIPCETVKNQVDSEFKDQISKNIDSIVQKIISFIK